ncbi:hypothetical protein BK011_06940 [Tenericutes bacterium MZ-XQ]|jgi:hypothetical protein|nr:hypothetical protein BK011_06940 [Tenericutes bacterium MZ-XQ]
MDQSIYKKMRLKVNTVGRYIDAPRAYRDFADQQHYIDFSGLEPNFYHVFLYSVQDFMDHIKELLPLINENTKLWISYQKKKKYDKEDLNRDKTFELGKVFNLIPYANVSLDETWSCVALKLMKKEHEHE